jgi:hypothetical protein
VRPLISLAHPALNQVPHLVHSARAQLVPAACALSLAGHSSSSSLELSPGAGATVSKKSATHRHDAVPGHTTRQPPSTPQHPLILIITSYARSGRRGRGFKSRHPDKKSQLRGLALRLSDQLRRPHSYEVQQRPPGPTARGPAGSPPRMSTRPPRWPRSTLNVLPDLHHDPRMDADASSGDGQLRQASGT